MAAPATCPTYCCTRIHEHEGVGRCVFSSRFRCFSPGTSLATQSGICEQTGRRKSCGARTKSSGKADFSVRMGIGGAERTTCIRKHPKLLKSTKKKIKIQVVERTYRVAGTCTHYRWPTIDTYQHQCRSHAATKALYPS